MTKIIIMPIFGIALFGWAVGKADGFGPVFNKPTKIIDGRPAAVVFFTAMSSAIAPKATLAINSQFYHSSVQVVKLTLCSCRLHTIW
jgi:NCS1 family nucleobase:cation symporter-1